MTKATKFTVDLGAGTVSGPADYMATERYRETMRRISEGRSAVINCAPSGVSLATLIEVALQTDYSAWQGARQMFAKGAL
jgi:hypothetical protein